MKVVLWLTLNLLLVAYSRNFCSNKTCQVLVSLSTNLYKLFGWRFLHIYRIKFDTLVMKLGCPTIVSINSDPKMGFDKMSKIAHARGEVNIRLYLSHDQVLACKQLTLVNTCVLFSIKAAGH
jgi:hypothetical protein